MIEVCSTYTVPRLEKAAQNIQAPTLVLHAPDDTLVSFDQGEFSARKIRRAQFIPMERGGHLALMLRSNASAKENVLEFLDQYNNTDRTGMPNIEIKGDLVCGK